jgi:hypothetical protein
VSEWRANVTDERCQKCGGFLLTGQRCPKCFRETMKADSTQPIATPVIANYDGTAKWLEDANGNELSLKYAAGIINSHAALTQQVADLQAEVARLRESEFPREREEACREFIEKLDVVTDCKVGWPSEIQTVFRSMFKKPL